MSQPQVQDQMQHTVISGDGTTIAYWRSGRGRPLVLVHGTTADHTRWRTMLRLFESGASLCNPTAPRASQSHRTWPRPRAVEVQRALDRENEPQRNTPIRCSLLWWTQSAL